MWRIGKVTSEKLSLRLVEEREKLMSEHPGYRMIGPDFVCSDAAIGELCQEVVLQSFFHPCSVAGVKLQLSHSSV